MCQSFLMGMTIIHLICKNEFLHTLELIKTDLESKDDKNAVHSPYNI